MTRLLQKTYVDIRSNRFLNLITVITISLSILLVSVFMLFFENASRVLEAWNQGGRAMVYLGSNFKPPMLPQLQTQLTALGGIETMTFIHKDTALERLQKELDTKSEFLSSLKTNPLPHALEITMTAYTRFDQVKDLARRIETLDLVDSVEYGQGWLGRFLRLFNLFKITGYAMCGIFLLIALFITANTVRLAFYARKTEVEIMRLVGATEGFIKTPFYVEGVCQGLLGGLLGLGLLLVGFLTLSSGMRQNFGIYAYLDIRFLSWQTITLILFSSTFLGWFGCVLSLRQNLK